jgi:hypothetical protein
MERSLHIMRWIFVPLMAAVVLIPRLSAQPAKEYGFGFNNFSDPELGWDIYRNSFYGIPESPASAAFDAIFYEAAFKSAISKSGNCYGISLLALLMVRDGGEMGYCAPPYQYSGDMNSGAGPTDPKLRRVINVLHGHQLSLASIMEMLDQIGGSHSHDGSVVIKRCETLIAKEGPCIVSVTKSFNPSDGGHSMIAYAATGNKIMLVDPNRIWANTNDAHRHWYEADSNYIECGSGYWKFDMKSMLPAPLWPTGAGHLTVYPLSVAAPTGRVPSSLGLNAAELLAKIFIVSKSSDATVLQVSDGKGKRLFKPGSKEIDCDTTTGMRSIVPWFPSVSIDNPGPFPFEMYFSVRTPRYLEVELYTGKTGAVFGLGNNDSYVTLDCETPGDTITVAVSGIGTPKPSYEILRSKKSMIASGKPAW